MTDSRVVLQLPEVLAAAEKLCDLWCADPWSAAPVTAHRPPCLQPALAERTRLLEAAAPTGQLTPDCRDGKCDACPGCICDHHRHSHREVSRA